MSKILTEVLEANRNYAAGFGEKAKLALPPAKRIAIVTCMDARLDPAKFAGLAEGDDEATTRDHIRASLAEFVPEETERRWIEPALVFLLGFGEAPSGGREELFAAPAAAAKTA